MDFQNFVRQASTFITVNGRRVKIGGYRPDPSDEGDTRYSAERFSDAELPPRVDLREFMTEVEQQGELGSCTANAMAGAYEYLAKRQKGWAEDVSRLFIYFNARELDGSVHEDAGSYLKSCIETLQKHGACFERTWPYNVKKVFEKPHENAYDEGVNFLIDDSERIEIDLHDMKHCLAEGYPFAFGVILFESFEKVGKDGRVTLPNPETEKSDGGHAMLCVGYSDTDEVFIVRNSWGSDWGDQGYCYIPYDYMTNSEICGDCWTIRSVTDVDLSEGVWKDDTSIFSEMVPVITSFMNMGETGTMVDEEAEEYVEDEEDYEDEEEEDYVDEDEEDYEDEEEEDYVEDEEYEEDEEDYEEEEDYVDEEDEEDYDDEDYEDEEE